MPLIVAVIMKERTPYKAGLLSMIFAPLITIVLSVFKLTVIDPLYIGMGTSLIVFLAFLIFGRKNKAV